jgi:hypothetical protein
LEDGKIGARGGGGGRGGGRGGGGGGGGGAAVGAVACSEKGTRVSERSNRTTEEENLLL